MYKGAIEKWLVGGFLIVCLFVIAMIAAKASVATSLLFSLSPFIVILFLSIASNPFWGLVVIFILNYFIMGISRYLPIGNLGTSTDIMIAITLIAFIIRSAFKEDIEWSKLKGNLLLRFLLIWLLYCIAEVLNTSAVTTAWLSTIRQYAVYPIFIVIFTTLLFNKFKHLKMVLFLWSIFTLLAVVKVIIQIRFGFDSGENRWLNEGSNANTHLLITGIRYFSFFTDAGCFGASMGYSMVVFGIAAFADKNIYLRLYYLFIAGAATYAMFVSGTRGAIAVPLVGFALYSVCTNNARRMLTVGSFVLIAYIILAHTTIGSGYASITRMRTAFDKDNASLMVRQRNRAILATYIKNKPFGEGLGLSGSEGEEYAPGRLTTSIPNDSWFVKIWVETGPIGVTIHVSLLLFFVGYGLYLILFKIKSKEVRTLLAAILCGEMGLIISAWGNPIFLQYPNGILNYMIQAFVFMGPQFDKEIEIKKSLEIHED